MRVCLDGHIRKVTQLHFTCWPPMGEPLFPETLVSLAQKMLTLPYGSNSPILVHCAAGVGRIGTIIPCDVNLRMVAAEGAVDLLGTLQRLREQRPNMVDNADQYKLAHLVVLASLTESEWQDEALNTGISVAARHVPFISEKNGVPEPIERRLHQCNRSGRVQMAGEVHSNAAPSVDHFGGLLAARGGATLLLYCQPELQR